MINKPKLSKGVTCSKDKLDDLLSAEEPNDEFYNDNTIEDRMNLDKSKIDFKKYFENIKQFFEQFKMKLQMTYQQKMNMRKLIKLLTFLIERLCLGSWKYLHLPKYKDISIIKKLLHTIKLYGVELAQPQLNLNTS
jgi:hypothetical protein